MRRFKLICTVRVIDCTVNIDLSDITNRYTVPYRRLELVYEKKNRSLVLSGSRKIPNLGSTVQWETRQASFPNGTVGPWVGIFLSPLDTNDGWILFISHMGKIENKQPHIILTSICDVIVMLHPQGGGGRVTLIFSSYVGWGPASTVHPQKYQEFQAPQKIFEILPTPKNIPHSLP